MIVVPDWGSLQLLLRVIGVAQRADLEGRGGSKHDNLQVSQFQKAGWPIPLVSIREQLRAEQSGAGRR